MGDIVDQITHRILRNPHAQRTRNFKKIVVIGISLMIALSVFWLWYTLTTKHITLVVNDETQQVDTRVKLVEDLLDEYEIHVGEHDDVSIALDSELHDGDVLKVKHAIPVFLNADGAVEQVYTTESTVAGVLKQQELALGEQDKVMPSLDSAVVADEEIRVVRVETIVEEVEETIPFETVTQNDDSLLKGKEQIVQAGKDALLLKRFEKVLEDGVIVSEKLIAEEIADPGQQQIVAIGTKNPVTVLSASSPTVQQVTRDGISFGVKKVLSNVTLTAYDAGPNSTGKTEEHPWYGMTYTGTEVTEGRTIAVDPNVIPLGWWVYIEGIGLRRAEDTGSAIKGNIIDIYFESEEHALKFGRKSGYTVYIIGPKKPETP